MNPIDIIIVVVVALLLGVIIYFRFIKNKDKGECAYCGSSSKSNLVKEYYKCKCEGKDIK